MYGGANAITIEPTAVNSNGTRYTTVDTLGSPRVITNSTGSVVSRHDYLPFGQELFAGTGGRTTAQGYSASDGVRQHFTQQERDVETGLDYFNSRYYSSSQGRFSSADVFVGRLANPQTLNLYSYVKNNPLKYVDPSGHSPQDPIDVTRIEIHDHWYKHIWQSVKSWFWGNSQPQKTSASHFP